MEKCASGDTFEDEHNFLKTANVELLQLTERSFKQVFFCPRVQVLDFHVFNVMQFIYDCKKFFFLF